MKISFVTPTYNRENLICETVDSILNVLNFYSDIEIIIVDDASQDNTLEVLNQKYEYQIETGVVKIFGLSKNIGVTGAKNYGADVARGEWIIFLDSDDLIVYENFFSMVEFIKHNVNADAYFFSCIDFDGNVIGNKFDDKFLSLKEYQKEGMFGEKLPVISKALILEFPYHTDLRGFEGLTYMEMLFNQKKLYVSNLIVRKYRLDNNDRLSTFRGRVSRSRQMYLGFGRMSKIIFQYTGKVSLNLIYKVLIYGLLSIFNKIFILK